MALSPNAFFTQELALAFDNGAVVGNSYYAAPVPESPLLLRISFQSTIRQGEYGGLRLSMVHADRGPIDEIVLSFADHGTFRARDRAAGRTDRSDGYGVFRDFTPRASGPAPWAGGDWTRLKAAVTRYADLWFSVRPTPPRTASATVARTRSLPLAENAAAHGRRR
ncbi:hypothetical protein [Streptomyces erythrochromogenes]|uniref:hypothetical protein n=1 Tax=Streptomyces erythrochromogenes TaxID=285574 RepID=UPI0002F93B22